MKVGIIGAGAVGSTAAFALVMRGVANEVVLVDQKAELARAQAEDVLHAVPFSAPARVRAGGYESLDGAAIVIVTAGTAQKPGETRLALASRNASIVRSIVNEVRTHAPGA